MKKIHQIWKSELREISFKKEAKLYTPMLATYECSLKMEMSQKKGS